MAPIKFEEQLKEKLEKRTLSPSAEGWAKLSERLDAEDKKTKRPIYWWLSIAAMFVAMIAISVQFFNKEEGTTVAPQIVNEETDEINNDKNDAILIDNNTELVSEEDKFKEEQSVEDKFDEPVKSNVKQLVKSNIKPKTQLATNTKKGDTKNLKIDNEVAVNNKVLVNQPEIDITVIAEALENSSTNNAVQLDREVDSLLKLASKELTKSKLIKDTSKMVDANALLEQVQDEMGQSFRSKVYEMLKDSYKTVKTAVAQRNN